MFNLLKKFLPSDWYLLGAGLLLVIIRGLFLDVMDVDASQYASIAMEMLQNGQWLEVQHRGSDYLDKPPLLFWLSGLSYAVFGIANWSYKLPSLLGAGLGLWAVWRFARMYYGAETARYAVFILAASIGFMLLCNDVRTDTLLLGFSAAAISWTATAIREPGRNMPFIWAGFFAGIAMLAKGPIGLVMPGLAAGAHLLLRRDWKGILNPRWLLLLLAAGLPLIPMCWGLYQQYDLHPEKVINGRTGVSGLYFFFWEQSFGRITGENVWKNNTPAWYFVHVYLYAFLPWVLLLPAVLWLRFRSIISKRFHLPAGEEALSLGAFALTFLALSLSRYKLPHYIFITLPWAAVLTAGWITEVRQFANGRIIWWIAYTTAFLLSIGLILIPTIVFPGAPGWFWLVLLLLFAYAVWQCIANPFPDSAAMLVKRGVYLFIAAAFVMNFYFYPNLLPYQSTASIMKAAREKDLPADKIGFYGRHGHALDVYNGQLLKEIKSPDALRSWAQEAGPVWVYTDQKNRDSLARQGLRFETEIRARHFQVALLKPVFLNAQTRSTVLDSVFLIRIDR